MSRENFAKLLKSAANDKQLRERLENSDSYESLKAAANERGIDLGDVQEDQAAQMLCVATQPAGEELSEADLQEVAGGFTATDDLWRNGFLIEVLGVMPNARAPKWATKA